jgi:hypothetical protein
MHLNFAGLKFHRMGKLDLNLRLPMSREKLTINRLFEVHFELWIVNDPIFLGYGL